MGFETKLKSEHVVVDTSAFIKNTNLQDIGRHIMTVPEVVDEITSQRQIRRLTVLPYDLEIKEAFPESIRHVTEFSKKTGDYPSLSATDIKVLALTYQLEKEHVGVKHLRTVPEISRTINYCTHSKITTQDIAGFHNPGKHKSNTSSETTTEHIQNKIEDNVTKKLDELNIDEKDSVKENLQLNSVPSDDEDASSEDDFYDCVEEVNHNDDNGNDEFKESFSESEGNEILVKVQHSDNENSEEDVSDEEDENSDCDDDEDDSGGWITLSNVKEVRQKMDGGQFDDTPAVVACLTTDFAMQNVLKQMGLNVLTLDGKVIKHMRTFILRCHACYKTTSIMTKVFCAYCGNKTLKKVAVSLDADGKQVIHINLKRPLTARGKKFTLPKPRGGKHKSYPILCEDQPMPDQRPSRLASIKNNPLEPDYIAGFSPFVMRDINSKSAMLGVQNKSKEVKYWMKKNPNEACGRRRKKK